MMSRRRPAKMQRSEGGHGQGGGGGGIRPENMDAYISHSMVEDPWVRLSV